MKYYFLAFKNYINIFGTASRKEFWWFYGINFVISFVLSTFDLFFHLNIFQNTNLQDQLPILMDNEFGRLYISSLQNIGLLNFIYILAIIIPTVTVILRRLNDIKKTKFWILILLVPIIGWLVILDFACKKSKNNIVKNGNKVFMNFISDGDFGTPFVCVMSIYNSKGEFINKHTFRWDSEITDKYTKNVVIPNIKDIEINCVDYHTFILNISMFYSEYAFISDFFIFSEFIPLSTALKEGNREGFIQDGSPILIFDLASILKTKGESCLSLGIYINKHKMKINYEDNFKEFNPEVHNEAMAKVYFHLMNK